MQVLQPFMEQIVPDLHVNNFFRKTAPLRFGKIVDHRISQAHWHCHPQIWYTIRGSYYHTILGERVLQTPGSLAVIPPFSPHSIDSAESKLEETEVYSILFPYDAFEKNLLPFFPLNYSSVAFEKFLLTPFSRLDGEDKERADELFLKIVATIGRDNLETRFSKIFADLYHFFELFIKKQSSVLTSKDISDSSLRSKYINDSVYFSIDNFRAPITIEDARNSAIMSRRSFTEKFKTTVGQTYTEFLINLRTRQAISHIKYTDWPISEIADICGFANSGHLISVCTDYCGITPLQLRAKYMEYAEKYNELLDAHLNHMIHLNNWSDSTLV